MTKKQKKQPTLIAYTVDNNGQNDQSFYTRIGAAWSHKDGDGLNIILKALPIDGKIVLLSPKKSEQKSA